MTQPRKKPYKDRKWYTRKGWWNWLAIHRGARINNRLCNKVANNWWQLLNHASKYGKWLCFSDCVVGRHTRYAYIYTQECKYMLIFIINATWSLRVLPIASPRFHFPIPGIGGSVAKEWRWSTQHRQADSQPLLLFRNKKNGCGLARLTLDMKAKAWPSLLVLLS